MARVGPPPPVTDLSGYLKTADADLKYALINHTHTTAQITGLDSSIQSINTEISSLKSSVSSGKATIAAAVTDKGVQTAADATFEQMANNIRNILSIGSLDISGDQLSDWCKSATTQNGELVTNWSMLLNVTNAKWDTSANSNMKFIVYGNSAYGPPILCTNQTAGTEYRKGEFASKIENRSNGFALLLKSDREYAWGEPTVQLVVIRLA